MCPWSRPGATQRDMQIAEQSRWQLLGVTKRGSPWNRRGRRAATPAAGAEGGLQELLHRRRIKVAGNDDSHVLRPVPALIEGPDSGSWHPLYDLLQPNWQSLCILQVYTASAPL